MQKEWNIQALEADLSRLLSACHSNFERINVKALHGIEVRKLADELSAQGKLTPGGRAIAEKYGWRA